MPASPNLVADAVVSAIRALGLVPNDKVRKLKTPSLPSGYKPPFIAVCVGEGGEEGQTEDGPVFYFDGAPKLSKINRYPTTVVIIRGGNGKALGDDETMREWRVAIEEAVGDSRAAFASVPGWNKTTTIGKAPFDGSLIPKDLSYSATGFNIEVIEPRAT